MKEEEEGKKTKQNKTRFGLKAIRHKFKPRCSASMETVMWSIGNQGNAHQEGLLYIDKPNSEWRSRIIKIKSHMCHLSWSWQLLLVINPEYHLIAVSADASQPGLIAFISGSRPFYGAWTCKYGQMNDYRCYYRQMSIRSPDIAFLGTRIPQSRRWCESKIV